MCADLEPSRRHRLRAARPIVPAVALAVVGLGGWSFGITQAGEQLNGGLGRAVERAKSVEHAGLNLVSMSVDVLAHGGIDDSFFERCRKWAAWAMS